MSDKKAGHEKRAQAENLSKDRVLTPKQELFVAEYLVDRNATQAAIRAGYSQRSAMQQGERLLRNDEISVAVAARLEQHLEKVDFTAQDVLREAGRLAFADIRSFYREDGSLKPISEWTPEQGSQAGAMETVVKNVAAGDNHTDTIHKVKLWEKMKALDLLSRYFRLVGDKIDVSVTVTYEERRQRLEEGRARAAKVLEGTVVG